MAHTNLRCKMAILKHNAGGLFTNLTEYLFADCKHQIQYVGDVILHYPRHTLVEQRVQRLNVR